MKLVPVSQITYGTDYPYFPLNQIDNLRQLNLPAADLQAIMSGNAARPAAAAERVNWKVLRAAVALAAFFAPAPAQAQAPPARAQTAVDLQLVLAVDASGSVNQSRFELQKQGYVAAFRSPRVLQAIRSGATRPSPSPWCNGPARDAGAGGRLDADRRRATSAAPSPPRSKHAPRQLFGGGTSISGAIDHAMTLFPEPVSRRAPRHRRLRRRLQQPRPPGHARRATKRCAPASASTACRSSRSSPISTATTTTT